MTTTKTATCDCGEEYGPCENHSQLMVQREGASSRTGDELSLCFIEDAIELGVEVSQTMRLDLDGLEWDSRWLAGDHGQTLEHYRSECEDMVYGLDNGPWWVDTEDGYRIMRITGGPLAS